MDNLDSPDLDLAYLKKLFVESFQEAGRFHYPAYAKFMNVAEQFGVRYAGSIKGVFTRNAGAWVTTLVSLRLLVKFPDARSGAITWISKVLSSLLRGPKGSLYRNQQEKEKEEEEGNDEGDDDDDDDDEIDPTLEAFRTKLQQISGSIPSLISSRRHGVGGRRIYGHGCFSKESLLEAAFPRLSPRRGQCNL